MYFSDGGLICLEFWLGLGVKWSYYFFLFRIFLEFF